MPRYQASIPAPAAMITVTIRHRPARISSTTPLWSVPRPSVHRAVGDDRHRSGGDGDEQAGDQCHRVAAADDGEQRALR